MPDDSQLCRLYKPVLDESAPDLILARRKYKVDTTTTLETPHVIYGMNDGMNISDHGLPYQYLFQFSHSNQTTNIGFLRILRSQQTYFLTLSPSSSMADKEEHSLQNQNVCLHNYWPIGSDITTQTKMVVD